MFFFDSFIITQRTFYMTLGFIVLFLETVINFACSGLFKKNSQKFSNITLCSALILSSLCLLPFVLGFLNPHSTSSIYFFNKKKNGSYGASGTNHDDMVMVRAIGLHICFSEMDLPAIIKPKPKQTKKAIITEATI